MPFRNFEDVFTKNCVNNQNGIAFIDGQINSWFTRHRGKQHLMSKWSTQLNRTVLLTGSPSCCAVSKVGTRTVQVFTTVNKADELEKC